MLGATLSGIHSLNSAACEQMCKLNYILGNKIKSLDSKNITAKQSTNKRTVNSNITTHQTLINKEDRANEQLTTKPQ
jgi:hypothetical protein